MILSPISCLVYNKEVGYRKVTLVVCLVILIGLFWLYPRLSNGPDHSSNGENDSLTDVRTMETLFQSISATPGSDILTEKQRIDLIKSLTPKK